MQPFRLHILGCGSAKPTPRHNPSSQIVELRSKMFMIDCGEGTQTALCSAHIGFNKLNTVFISHLHGDHCFGLIGMISSFGLMGRVHPLHIYAHKNLQQLLQLQLEMFCANLGFRVELHPIDTDKSSVIYEDRSLTVTTIPLNHRVPCCGFLFREKPTLPHIRRDMIDYYQIPFSQINNIKNGQSWTTPDGQIIDASRLTTPPDIPRSYAYCSDTRFSPTIVPIIKDVDLLYHEATYADDKQQEADKYHHSTARQAAQIAQMSDARRLLIGHYSARYNDESILLNEAREVFPNTFLAKEKTIFTI